MPACCRLVAILLSHVLLAATQHATTAGPTLAARVGACNATAGWPKRYTDTVVSIPHKLVFVDNVKAGSTVIRSLLSRLNPPATWFGRYANESISDWTVCKANHHARLTTGCLSGAALLRGGYFVFGFVRAPYVERTLLLLLLLRLRRLVLVLLLLLGCAAAAAPATTALPPTCCHYSYTAACCCCCHHHYYYSSLTSPLSGTAAPPWPSPSPTTKPR